MRCWTFNVNTCGFERTNSRTAFEGNEVAVINDCIDVYVIRERQSPKRWSSGEQLIVAGIEFEREQFE